jgi:hypothetical protein
MKDSVIMEFDIRFLCDLQMPGFSHAFSGNLFFDRQKMKKYVSTNTYRNKLQIAAPEIFHFLSIVKIL